MKVTEISVAFQPSALLVLPAFPPMPVLGGVAELLDATPGRPEQKFLGRGCGAGALGVLPRDGGPWLCGWVVEAGRQAAGDTRGILAV